MLSSFERMIALRYLRARREEGFISLIALFSLVGIALGVATLIVVMAVMNGVRGELIRSVIGLEGHITLYANAGTISDYNPLSKDIKTIPGVENAFPKVEGQIMVTHRGTSSGAMVLAYQEKDLASKPLLMDKIVEGDAEAFKRGEGIIVGKRMAEKMGVSVGDDMTLISPEGQATVAGMIPRIKAYKVVALFSIGMFAYDSGLIVMPFQEAQTYFKLKSTTMDNASAIEIFGVKPDNVEALSAQIQQKFGDKFRIYDWKSSNNHIFQAVIVQRNVMFLILTLIILVASFNIISSLIMLVREKGRDIAVLRTMGASRRSVMKIFIACGSFVGIAGTVAGVFLGLLIAFNTENIQRWLESIMGHSLFPEELYFLSHLPSKVDPSEVIMVVALALGLSFLATIYPAYRAAKLDPAEALRYE